MHPNIVTIYDADLYQDFCYIAMEYVEGQTLEAFCKPENLLPAERVVKVLFSVCKGLEYAHRNGIIHRDIKPSNLILSSTGQVKITDFSIAYIKRGQSTLEKGLFGSPSYMCPEQIRGQKFDHRCDIWALGVVFYEMLTGHLPFEGDYPEPIMYAIVNEKPTPLSQYLDNVPDNLQHIIDKPVEIRP